jgi:spermidine/putrescine transport system permease protein
VRDWREDKRFFWATMVLPTLWFVVFFVAPMAWVWLISFGENNGPVDIAITGTFNNYAKAFSPEMLTVMWQSVWISLLTTLICLVVGFPVALAMTFASEKQKAWLLLLL